MHWSSHHTGFQFTQSLIVQSESVCLISVHPSGRPEGNGANLARLSQAVTCSLPLILLTGVSLLLCNYYLAEHTRARRRKALWGRGQGVFCLVSFQLKLHCFRHLGWLEAWQQTLSHQSWLSTVYGHKNGTGFSYDRSEWQVFNTAWNGCVRVTNTS